MTFNTFAAVIKGYSYILLTIFTLFLTATAVDFSSYLKVLNAGANIEDVNSIPEEQHEDSSKHKNHFHPSDYSIFLAMLSEDGQNHFHYFSLSENIYFDVPHSPPDLA